MKSGDILFWGLGVHRPNKKTSLINDFYTWLIKTFNKSRFLHTGILYIEDNNYYVYEALLEGVKKHKLKNEYFFIVNTNKEFTHEDKRWLDDKLNQPYSKLEAALSVFKIHLSSNKKWFCSELVHSYLERKLDKMDSVRTPVGILKILLKDEKLTLKLVKVQ